MQFAVRFVIGTAVLILLVVILLPMLAQEHSGSRVSCQNNLKQMGIIFKMYSGEAKGAFWPPIGPYPGKWVPDLPAIYPEYLSDFSVLMCPSHSETGNNIPIELSQQLPDLNAAAKIAATVARNYTYTGWDFASEEDIAAVKLARVNGSETMRYADVTSPNRNVHRLEEAITRFLITDSENPAANVRPERAIPTLFDTVTQSIQAHSPLGANVLYKDGHVEFVPENNQFPITDTAQGMLDPDAAK